MVTGYIGPVALRGNEKKKKFGFEFESKKNCVRNVSHEAWAVIPVHPVDEIQSKETHEGILALLFITHHESDIYDHGWEGWMMW